jgi:lipopolysaccharide export LptBFGC system permease protein LptF
MVSNLNKKLIYFSFGAAGFVAAMCLLDLATGILFARQMVFDILFLISAAVVGYLAWDAYKDLA